MNIKTKLVGVTLPLLAAGLIPLAHAANPATGAADNDTLEEVIVTAEKRSERLQDVPDALTVVSESQLNDQHVTTLADLSRTTPALEMIQSFGGPGGGGQIRGVGTQSFTRSAEGSVGVVLDGVTLGDLNINNIFDVKQVEVLEGPQGTLYGLTSSAGIINITTNAPDPTKFETIWHADTAEKGVLGSEFTQDTLHGVVNIPLSPDSALRIAGSIDNYAGVQHDSFTGRDEDSANYGLRAHYLLKASDTFTVNLIADYQRVIGQEGGAGASFTYVYADPALTAELAQCGITPGWGNQDRCANHLQSNYDTNYGVSLQMDWDLGSVGTLTSISAYRRDETGPEAQDIQAEPLESPQLWSTGGLGASRQYSEELRIGSHSGGPFEYTAGLFYSNYLTLGYSAPGAFFHIQPVATPYFPPAPPGFGPPLGTVLLDVGTPTTALTQTTNDAAAAFGQVNYHATDRLSFLFGLRDQYQSITDFDSPGGFMPGTVGDTSGVTGIAQDQNNVSGKLGVQYKVTGEWTSYATVTKGYKGFQAQAATTTTPATIIKAEIPVAYEVGIKGETAGHRMGLDADVFYEHIQNYQGQECSLNPVGVLICLPNSFDLTTKGVELNVYGHVLPQWNVNGGFIYDVAEYPNGYSGENPSNLTGGPGSLLPMGGLQIVGAPKEKLTFSSDYTVPMGAVSWFVGGDTVYKSDLRLGYSPDPHFVYPAHWELGLRTGFRSADGHWGVTAFGRDINNSHEPITLFGGPAFSAPAPYGPFFNPNYPNGQIAGVSGWIGPQALRELGLSFDLKF